MISFVVPAHDEERLIGGTLGALDAAARALGQPFEIVVVDDASSDRTAAIAAQHGARVIRVEHRQISATRNAGARAARGSRLVFIDADTRVNSDVVAAAVAVLEAGAVGGGCRVRFDGRLPAWARLVEPQIVMLSRLARLAPGCFLFCSRDAFLSVGGFDESVYAGEEVLLSRALNRRGRFVILRESVLTSGRKMRTHATAEFVDFVALIARQGMGSVRSRDGLGMWYGPRRDDPEAEARAAS